jgi:hypothetical protein
MGDWMLTDEDRKALHEVAVALRASRAGTDALGVRLAEDTASRLHEARHNRHASLATAGSRLFMAVIIAGGIYGAVAAIHSSPAPAVVQNVATKSDIDCVRSDLAVYFVQAAPDPLCGPPPGLPTKGGRP